MGARRSGGKQPPLRSCVACRKRLARHDTWRFVLGPDEALVFDGRGRLPGRGAHTCPDVACLRQACLRRGFDRSFRRSLAVPDAAALEATMAAWCRRRLLELLGLERRSGRLLAGGDVTLAGLRRGKVRLVVLAADLAARRQRELGRRAAEAGAPVLRFGTQQVLGRAVGRSPPRVVGVGEGPLLPVVGRVLGWCEALALAERLGGCQGANES